MPRQWLGEVMRGEPAEVRFRFTNEGDSPLRLTSVFASCGCIEVSYPTNDVAPGDEATITAVYDARTLGTFFREIEVCTTADDEVTYLTFEGRVVSEESDHAMESAFPVDLGVVRLSSNVVEFDDVNRGDRPHVDLRIFNATKQVYRPQLMHLPAYLSAIGPEEIAGGRVGTIRLTLESDRLRREGLTQTSIYLARYEGDRVSRDNELLINAVLLPPLMEATAQSPQMSIVRGETKKGWTYYTIVNSGLTPLEISALQPMDRELSLKLKSRTVEPHSITQLRISGEGRTLLISNDPLHLKTIIDNGAPGE